MNWFIINSSLSSDTCVARVPGGWVLRCQSWAADAEYGPVSVALTFIPDHGVGPNARNDYEKAYFGLVLDTSE